MKNAKSLFGKVDFTLSGVVLVLFLVSYFAMLLTLMSVFAVISMIFGVVSVSVHLVVSVVRAPKSIGRHLGEYLTDLRAVFFLAVIPTFGGGAIDNEEGMVSWVRSKKPNTDQTEETPE